jgi:Na+/H+-dicarboxylate symporter
LTWIVDRRARILLALVLLLFVPLCVLLLPSAAPLIGMLMLGNLFRESGVVERISKTAQNELMNIITILLGVTVGATANQNGTALFEGITVLFLAQFFGVPLTIGDQVVVMGLAILAGIGTAGVPGGSWPMIAIILTKVGVPGEAIGICLGVDRLLDMSRTVVNVTGDIAIAACVSTMEGESDQALAMAEA